MKKNYRLSRKKLNKLYKITCEHVNKLISDQAILIDEPDSLKAQEIKMIHKNRKIMEKALWAGFVTGREGRKFEGLIPHIMKKENQIILGVLEEASNIKEHPGTPGCICDKCIDQLERSSHSPFFNKVQDVLNGKGFI
jgi:hypothetical protein